MSGPITTAIERCRQGDLEAQNDLARELKPFFEQLLRYVRRHRSPALQARIDSEGVVNEALYKLLAGIQAGKFPNLRNHRELEKLLTTLVKRMLSREIRSHTADKRHPSHEQPLDSDLNATSPDGNPAPAPTDFSAAELTAWLEKLQKVLRTVDEKAMDILERRLAGLSNREIAQELGLGLRTVQATIKEMREAWEKATAAEQ